MIHSKVNPVGIDEKIAKFQSTIDSLWSNSIVYGRLYFVQNSDYVSLCAYKSNGDYEEIFTDTVNSVFGFIASNDKTIDGYVRTKLTIICSCNLDALYGSQYRKDEESILDLVNVLRNRIAGEEVEVKTKLEDVFSGATIDRIKFRNVHPFFNFSLSFNVTYSVKNC